MCVRLRPLTYFLIAGFLCTGVQHLMDYGGKPRLARGRLHVMQIKKASDNNGDVWYNTNRYFHG
jgi:hypothetical protein